MSRVLNQTVLVGGVVYPAGTPEEAINGRVKREGVWHDSEAEAVEEATAAVREVEESNHPRSVELREFVEDLIEVHLADLERPIAEVLGQVAEQFGYQLGDSDADATDDGDGETDGDEGDGDELAGALPPTPVVDYSAMPLDTLKAEAEKRGLKFEGSGANGNVIKADHDALAAALAAGDDA